MTRAGLAGRAAVVTGAGSGIGAATAVRLAAEGVTIVALDLDEGAAGAVVAELPGSGHISAGVDVADESSVAAVCAHQLDRFGAIDMLVNSAGITGPTAPSWELPPADWYRVLGVNLSGTFHTIRALAPAMKQRGYGRIVNLSSVAGKDGNPNAAAYSASKAGVIALTKSVAKELATSGVLVNCVTPAVIQTPMNATVSAEQLGYMTARIPMGRLGQAGEVAELITWLCSEHCSFSTGAAFDISGGRSTY